MDAYQDFPGGLVVKNPPSNTGDMGLILGGESKISFHYFNASTLLSPSYNG